MGKRRRNSGFADGLNAFAASYKMARGVMEDRDKQQVADTMKDGMAKSTEEAAASGGTEYTLDRGADDKATPDYSYKDRAARDSNAGDMNAAASMQAEIDAEKTGGAGLQPQAPAASPTQTMTRVPAAPSQPGLESVAPDAMTRVPPAPGSVTALVQQSRNPAPAQPAPEAVAPAADSGPRVPMTSEQFYAQGEIAKPKLLAQDIFYKKYAPGVTAKLMEQGKVEEATKFEDWTSSRQGKAYGQAWMEGMNKVNSGDIPGGIKAAQDLYNKQLPDGQYAVAVPGRDGDYSIEVRDEKTNKLIGSRSGKAQDMVAMAYGMLSPEQVYKIKVEAPAAEAAQIAKEGRTVAGQIKVAQATPGTPTELERTLALRNSFTPGSEGYKLAEAKIGILTTRAPGTVVNNFGGTPYQMAGGGQGLVDKSGQELVPLKGSPNVVAEADRLDAAYEMRPMVAGSPVERLFNVQTGKRASDPEVKAYNEAQVLRAAQGRKSQGNAGAGLKH